MNRKDIRPKGELVKLEQLIPQVKENLGIENNLKISALNELWPLVTSFDIASNSKIAYFDKENNLVISVKSSTLATELSMQKTSILSRLKSAIRNTDINFKDIRFKY